MALRPPKPSPESRDLMARRRARHPRFVEAVIADTRITLAYRAEGVKVETTLEGLFHALRLAWVSDAFFAQICYRAKARWQALGIPVLPRLAHHLAMATAQVCIGDPVVMAPGVYIAHGQVVVDGISEVGPGSVLFPWTTIGLRAGDFTGPVIGRNVRIGTGAKVVGPVTVGDGASVGANAVVVADVPAGMTAVGVPARAVGQAPPL